MEEATAAAAAVARGWAEAARASARGADTAFRTLPVDRVSKSDAPTAVSPWFEKALPTTWRSKTVAQTRKRHVEDRPKGPAEPGSPGAERRAAMPGGDGTGPMSRGPVTGGGGGRGRGMGFARGQGRRNRRWAQPWSGWRTSGLWGSTPTPRPPETERDRLERDKAALETELENLSSRLADLDQS
jgi:hypothetical protein